MYVTEARCEIWYRDSSSQGAKPALEYQFTAEEWARLTPVERVRLCRLLGAEAHQKSKRATGEVKRAYLRIALGWDALANEIEDTTL